jgi:hypothetical protein
MNKPTPRRPDYKDRHMSEFQRGESYTRIEIHRTLGGGLQDYLPHRDGRVVAACLSPDLNPDAPSIVLPGRGPEIQRWAEIFAKQRQLVPTFLKRGSNEWEYVGNYRVRGLITARPKSTLNDTRLGGTTSRWFCISRMLDNVRKVCAP